ncbi:sterile alpha motif domain-containing protein 9-like [Carassius gibelio]|uniref:sterile alpha motif domain-containing protein 9-like n=1 Tax=Carassius gibelio TaxID=101364 RepID=UPI0022783079|nr:sterile alpha motif domain-containing protein 9-like [Carassius gibelio]
MQVLWHFRKDLRCAKVIDSDLDTKELSKQVLDLFLLSNEQHAEQDRKTVLLLLDTKTKLDNDLRENLIEEIHKRCINTDSPVVIILNCKTTDFTLTDTLILNKMLSKEQIRQFREKLIQQIRLQRKGQRRVATINLLYHKDSDGLKLASEVLRDLREEFTCQTLTKSFKTETAENKDELVREIGNTANDPLRIYETHNKTVLLLLDIKGEKLLCYLLKSLLKLKRADQTNHPAFIIINAYQKSVVRVPGDVKLKLELLPEEKDKFAQKKLQLESKHKEMSQTFHAFNIMQGGFQKEDAEKLITEEMVKHIEKDTKSSSTRLLSFLALINSYVPGSHLLEHFCEDFIKEEEWSTDGENLLLETIMKPFEGLIVTYLEGEQEDQCIRLAHPMIADACLKILTEHKLTRFDIALDFLNSMVKGHKSNYDKICKSMFITRPKGLMEKETFSRLILDIMHESENNTEQCICLLELLSDLFYKDPFYPQALARFYYIKVQEENKYVEAERWAKMAIKRDPQNSHLRDTLGQIYKNNLRKIWIEAGETCTDVENVLAIAQSAIDAFKDVEEVAENESEDDTGFNNRGLFGFLQVCKILHSSPFQHFEQQHSDFIKRLKGAVESRYDFFEWYLAFSRLSLNKEEPDYFHEDIDECYRKYFTQREQTDVMTLNEKKMKSFGGLLHFLKSDINVLKQYKSTFDNTQSDNETQTVLYILANIILSQSGDPCEKAEDLQARLQRLWVREMQDRSPEFYLLILLLFWADEAPPGITNPPNLEKCLKKMHHSYKSKYQKYLRGRYLVPLFFFRKGKGLQRLVHASKLNQTALELLTEGDESVKINDLTRVNGQVRNHRVFAIRREKQIPVSPHDPSSVCTTGPVSFYLGFTIRGPVAFNIRYEENSFRGV